MRAWIAAFLLGVAAGWPGSAAVADELVMPYACQLQNGAVTLTPSAPQTYSVQGPRDEKTFPSCSLDDHGNTTCTTLMVHRFSIACQGGVAAWTQVSEAAAKLGVPSPVGLPAGYAPLANLQARMVLPALAKFSPHRDTVESEILRVDGVITGDEEGVDAGASGAWSTVVKAEMRPEIPGAALRVAGILSVMLAAFLLLGFFASRHPVAELDRSAMAGLRRYAVRFAQGLFDTFSRLLPEPSRNSGQGGMKGLINALSIATARLAEAELLVASLPRVLALREVLQNELETVRNRIGDISKAITQRPEQKTATLIRAALRDLDRITRIAQGVIKDTAAELSSTTQARQACAMPESLQEAYQLLGLNDDAAPNVAKKLVDALRMTWHPDFARDEADRRMREARMKQINAAWDMIKNRPAEAA